MCRFDECSNLNILLIELSFPQASRLSYIFIIRKFFLCSELLLLVMTTLERTTYFLVIFNLCIVLQDENDSAF